MSSGKGNRNTSVVHGRVGADKSDVLKTEMIAVFTSKLGRRNADTANAAKHSTRVALNNRQYGCKQRVHKNCRPVHCCCRDAKMTLFRGLSRPLA